MKFRRQILEPLLHLPDSPRRTALAYAVGVFLGFSPLLGLHTVLGLAVAFLLRLNRVAVLLGVWTNLPWLVVPYYGFATWFGMQLAGTSHALPLPEAGLKELFTWTYWLALAGSWRLLLPAALGSLVLGTLLALIAYPLSLRVIIRYRHLRHAMQDGRRE